MKLCYFTKVALSDYDVIIIFLISLKPISVPMFVDISFVDIDLCFLKAAWSHTDDVISIHIGGPWRYLKIFGEHSLSIIIMIIIIIITIIIIIIIIIIIVIIFIIVVAAIIFIDIIIIIVIN